MKVTDCTFAQAPEILAIFNDAIANSTALYDYKPRTMETMETWFEARRAGNYPIIGAFDDDGSLAGFASLGVFRGHAGYRYTVEHSVYVHPAKRERGVGKLLLREIIEAAKARDYHVMVGGIDSENKTSIRLHMAFGFTHCGRIRQAGFKFGRWLDLDFYQLVLPTPATPTET